VAPLRRKATGAFMPKAVWLLNGESSHMHRRREILPFDKRADEALGSLISGDRSIARMLWRDSRQIRR
jgi:hypothetical protein